MSLLPIRIWLIAFLFAPMRQAACRRDCSGCAHPAWTVSSGYASPESSMPHVQRVCIAAVLTLLAGCAATPAQKKAPAAAKVDDAGINALYARLDQDSTRYENALALAREGKTDQAQGEVAASLDDLRAAATQCSTTVGCEQQRFVDAFD